MLYDSGATHSFISHDCVDRLGLLVLKLSYMSIASEDLSLLFKVSFPN